MRNVSPCNGGCWFCSEKDDREMEFSLEFDTYFHMDCLLKAREDSNNPEAVVMAREFNLKN